MLMEHGATTSLEERRWLAKEAFAVSSHYDSAIFNYFDGEEGSAFRLSANSQKRLCVMAKIRIRRVISTEIWMLCSTRFTEKKFLTTILLDINAAVDLIDEFDGYSHFAILKHNNACGLASRPTVLEAWKDALGRRPGICIRWRT